MDGNDRNLLRHSLVDLFQLNRLPGSGQVHGSVDEHRAAQQDVPARTQFSTTATERKKKNVINATFGSRPVRVHIKQNKRL